MSESNPSTTEGKSITISLAEMAERYLGTMQRIHDNAAMVVQGTREVNERGYDELALAARYLPSQKARKGYAEAKPIAERWILKNLLADAFGALIPFLEDVRTVCALSQWKAAGSNQADLQPIFSNQRAEFLRLQTEGKLAHLKEKFAIEPQLSKNLIELEALAACLVRTDGIVPADGAAVEVNLVALDLIPTAGQNAPRVETRMGEVKKQFAPGASIALDKVEFLNVIATISLFMNATLRQLQGHLQKTEAAS